MRKNVKTNARHNPETAEEPNKTTGDLLASFKSDIQRDLGEPARKRKLTRYFLTNVSLFAATSIGFEVAFLLNPSKHNVEQVASMVTQLAGILIGFWAVGVFYFLGVINSQRDRVIQMQASLTARDSRTIS